MAGGVNGTNLHWADVTIISCYFLFVLAVGIWSSRRGKQDSIVGYFFASKDIHWILVGCSLFASNIGSTHFIGLSGAAAISGIAIAGFELNAAYVLLLLGWVFAPVYIAGKVYTMPQYLKKRFGGERIQIYLSVLSILLYVFIRISADMYAGAYFIKQSLQWDLYSSILVLLVVAAIFTVTGGLNAVMWTDLVQTILMLAGAVVISVISFIKVGGYHKLIKDFYEKKPNDSFISYGITNESCSEVTENYMHLLRPASDPELPWTGMTFGLTIAAMWSWCSDQVLVQRTLAARNLSHAKAGCILAGYLKLLPLFLFVFPGMASRVLFTDEVACSDPESCMKFCGNSNGCSNSAYVLLVVRLLSPGLSGLMLAVILAAVMTSLTSVFNSCTTLFSIDIWSRMRRTASETELLIVGRVFVILMVGISIAWIPVIEAAQNSQLFHYTQNVISCLAPPISAVYFLAVLSERINEKGAFYGLMVGLVVGIIRFVLDFVYTPPTCASGLPDLRPVIISKVHYLHFCAILFVLTCIITTVVSLLNPPIQSKYLQRLTVWTVSSKQPEIYQNKSNSADGVRVVMPSDNNKKGQQRKILNFLCCLNQDHKTEPVHQISTVQQYLEEKPLWRNICAFNAVILIGVATFVWVFYA